MHGAWHPAHSSTSIIYPKVNFCLHNLEILATLVRDLDPEGPGHPSAKLLSFIVFGSRVKSVALRKLDVLLSPTTNPTIPKPSPPHNSLKSTYIAA